MAEICKTCDMAIVLYMAFIASSFTSILQNSKMLENESFVERMMMRLVIDQFKNKQHIQLDAATSKRINGMIVKEYMNEFYGRVV